ncbi:hypothetical protein [Nocardia gipuzkoensis]
MAIDVRARHPTRRFLAHDMFASLRRWTGAAIPADEIPLSVTLDAMDAAGVDRALISAWPAPDGVLISNGEVAARAAEAPQRLLPIASVDLRKPMPASSPVTHWTPSVWTSRRASCLDGNARRVSGLTGWPLGANALARRRVAGVLGVLPRLGP